jgi:hypothetical protein
MSVMATHGIASGSLGRNKAVSRVDGRYVRLLAATVLVTLSLLALSSSAEAAPSFVRGASNSASGTTMTVSYGASVGAGHLLVGMFRASGTTSVSDSVNGAWTKAIGASDGVNSLWYKPNASAGSTTVTVNGSTSGSIRAVIAEYSGVATTSPLDGTSCNSGTGATATTGSTASVPAGELAFAGVGLFDSGITVTAGTGATLRTQLTGANGTSADEDVASTSSGTQSESFGLSTTPPGGWAACVATFKPPTATGASWFGSFAGGISASLYPFQSFVTGHVFATADPGGSGQQVAAFAINNADQPYSGSLPRGDLFEYYAGSSNPVFTPGKNYYISVPVRIPTGLPLMFDNATKFFQWAQIDYAGNDQPSMGFSIGGGEPPQSYPVNHYNFSMHDNGADDFPWFGPAVDGNWHTAILFVHFATDNTGYVQLWWDGVQQTFSNGSTTFNGPTLTISPDGQYHEALDIDSYRAFNAMPGTVTIYHGAPAIGTTYSSVYNTLTNPPFGP